MAEIYKDAIYLPALSGKKDLTIIDAGANIGIFSYFASQFAKKIYAIEPSQEHFEVLQYMIKYNKLDKVTPFKFALSMLDKSEEALSHYSNKTMFSLYGNIAENNTTGLVKTGIENVELKRLDTFFKEQKIEKCDFLKLDVEGVEYEVLGSDSFANIADKISQMVVEVHGYSGRNPQQIVDSLESRGFEVKQIPNDALLVWAIHK